MSTAVHPRVHSLGQKFGVLLISPKCHDFGIEGVRCIFVLQKTLATEGNTTQNKLNHKGDHEIGLLSPEQSDTELDLVAGNLACDRELKLDEL